MYNRQHLRGLKHLHISKTDWTSHLQWVMTFLEVNIFSVIKPTVCVPALFFTVNSVYSLLLHFPSVIQCLLETSHGHFQGREATNEGISLCYLNQKWPWRGFFFLFQVWARPDEEELTAAVDAHPRLCFFCRRFCEIVCSGFTLSDQKCVAHQLHLAASASSTEQRKQKRETLLVLKRTQTEQSMQRSDLNR